MQVASPLFGAIRAGVDTAVPLRRRVLDQPSLRGGVDTAVSFPSSGSTKASWQHLPVKSGADIPAAKTLPYPSLF